MGESNNVRIRSNFTEVNAAMKHQIEGALDAIGQACEGHAIGIMPYRYWKAKKQYSNTRVEKSTLVQQDGKKVNVYIAKASDKYQINGEGSKKES